MLEASFCVTNATNNLWSIWIVIIGRMIAKSGLLALCNFGPQKTHAVILSPDQYRVDGFVHSNKMAARGLK